MWVATHLHSGNKIYLLPDRQYSIGRVGSDIVLTDDTSISRSHALLVVSNEILKLEDKGSKYGTYHNEHIESKEKLLKGKPIELKEGDRILFGALKNEWVISKNNINTMVSSLNANDLVNVRKNLDLLGGNLISKWESKCTHLTMSEITITIKVLHALIEKIPIVSCSFWKDYLKSIQEKKEPPTTNRYLPKRSLQLSSAIQDEHLGFNENRKTLFSGKTFVFMTKKHYDMYSPIISKAGGKCKDLKNNVSKSFLIQKNTIVVQYVASTQSQGTQTINTISEYLETNSLRTIPDYEIGLAIVCCTIEKYCNPSYNAISNILPDSALGCPNFGTMLAENTSSQKSQYDSLPASYSEVPDSDSVNKAGPSKPLQSEVYDSEVVIVNYDSKISNSITGLPMISQSNNLKKISEDNSEKNIISADDFSEHLLLSSDLLLNEIQNSKSTPQSKKRATTPIEALNILNKKPRMSDHSVDKSEKTLDKETLSEKNVSCSFKSKIIDSGVKKKIPGFLQKSQVVSSQSETKANESHQSENKLISRKRGRIAQITNNDSDDDSDIFNFGSAPKQSRACEENMSDDEALFAFGNKNSKDEIDRAEHKNDDALPKTKTLNQKQKTVIANINSFNIKVSPIKAEPDGWMSALKIKSTDAIKEEPNNPEEELNNLIAIEVRVRKMNLTSKGSNLSIDRDPSNSSLNTSKKNFKAFVKKRNYKTQTQIITTFPIVVQPI